LPESTALQLLALPGFLAFFFVALWVGVRLLAQWGRTRELPELLLGVGVLCIGPVGFGLVMLASAAGAGDPEAPSLLGGLSGVAVAAGASAKAVFNWKIYHPRSRAVAALSFAAIALLAIALVGDGLTTGFAPATWMKPGWMSVRQLVQIGVLLWGAGEAFRWWRRMRRRIGIGLGDPVVANRFLLWSIGAGMAGAGSLVGMIVGLLSGHPMAELPMLTLTLSLFGMASAAALWLAFATPEWFKTWVVARAAVQTREGDASV
jgi:hypothetical protein